MLGPVTVLKITLPVGTQLHRSKHKHVLTSFSLHFSFFFKHNILFI